MFRNRFSGPMIIRMLIALAINIIPMLVLDFPIWVTVLVMFVLAVFELASVPYSGVWIWAAVVIVQRPFSWLTVLFFVAMAAFIASTIGVVILAFGRNNRRF